MIFHEQKMDVTPGVVPTVIHVKQYQTDLHLRLELYSRYGDISFETTPTVTIRGTKPDGTGFTKTGYVYDTSDATVTVGFFVEEQMTVVAGRIPYEIILEGENEDETLKTISATFYLEVQRAAMDVDTIVQDSEVREFETVVQQMVDEYLDDHPEKTTTVTPGSIDEGKLASSVVADYKNSNYVIPPGSIEEGMLSTAVKNAYKNSNYTLGQSAVHTDNIANNEVTEGKLHTDVQKYYRNDYVTPQMHGALANGSNDDSTAINAAVQNALGNANYGDGKKKRLVFPKGTYKITQPILLYGANNTGGIDAFTLDAENADIVYTGGDYAFKIRGMTNSNLHFGTITCDGANNVTSGGCIMFDASRKSYWTQYVNVYFKVFKAGTTGKCVYGCQVPESAGSDTEELRGGWINEIRWFHGRIMRGQYGFHLVRSTPGHNMTHWDFHEIGFEGNSSNTLTTALRFESANDGQIIGSFLFDNCRHEESFTTLIHTTGPVTKMNFYTQASFPESKLNVDSGATDWNIYCTLYDSYKIMNGVKVEIDHFYSLDGGIRIPNKDDLNEYLLPGNFYYNGNTSNAPLNGPTTGQYTLKVEVRDGVSTHGTAQSRYIRHVVKCVNGDEFMRNVTKKWVEEQQAYVWVYNDWTPIYGGWVDVTSLIPWDDQKITGITESKPAGGIIARYNQQLGMMHIGGNASVVLSAGYNELAVLPNAYKSKNYYVGFHGVWGTTSPQIVITDLVGVINAKTSFRLYTATNYSGQIAIDCWYLV